MAVSSAIKTERSSAASYGIREIRLVFRRKQQLPLVHKLWPHVLVLLSLKNEQYVVFGPYVDILTQVNDIGHRHSMLQEY